MGPGEVWACATASFPEAVSFVRKALESAGVGGCVLEDTVDDDEAALECVADGVAG